MSDGGAMMKAEIRAVGIAWPHEPDELGRTWTVQSWQFDGGDFPGFDTGTNAVAGWTPAELALIADLAMTAGHDVALERANRYRSVAGGKDGKR